MYHIQILIHGIYGKEVVMKLTIITIAYNSAEDIGRTIESVLAQEQGTGPIQWNI